MVDFNESEGESAFLVVRSTKGVWFDNPHVFHRSLAKVPISFCFAEGAQVQTELGPTASVKVGGYFASSADYEEWYQRRRASLTLPPSLGAEVRTRTPGSALSLRCPKPRTNQNHNRHNDPARKQDHNSRPLSAASARREQLSV